MCWKSSLLGFSFKQTKWIFLLACMFSLVLCIVFEISYHTNIKKDEQSIVISIYDRDRTSYSKNLSKYLESSLNATIVTGNKEKMENQVITYRATAGITIPEGFGQGIEEKSDEFKPVVLKFSNDEISTLVTMVVDEYICSTKEDATFMNRLADQEQIVPENNSYAVKKAMVTAIGFLPQVLMIMAICLASFLVYEKQEGNLMRIYISPVSFLQYLLGRGGVSVLASMIPTVALFAFAVASQGGFKDYLLSSLLTAVLFTIFMTLTAFYLGLRFSTQNTVFLVIVGLTSVGSIIGGCFFDIVKSVQFIKLIAKAFPHYWLMKGSRGILENSSLKGFHTGFCVLIIYLIIVIILNYMTYRRLDRNGGRIG